MSDPDKQNSHMLAGLDESDGYVLVPAGQKRIEPAEPLVVRLFPWSSSPKLASAKDA